MGGPVYYGRSSLSWKVLFSIEGCVYHRILFFFFFFSFLFQSYISYLSS